MVDSFSSSVAQGIESRGHVQPDEIIDHVLDFWASRSRQEASSDKSAVEWIYPLLETFANKYSAYYEGETAKSFKRGRNKAGFVKTIDKRTEELYCDLASAALDWRLLETIIRQLAVIGVPIHASVVCRCPDVLVRLSQLLPQEVSHKMLSELFSTLASSDDAAKWIDDAAKRKAEYAVRVVALALEILAARGLIFRFLTHDDQVPARPDAALHRYQVHRLVQLYIYRKLGSQNIEPADSYSFTVSVFAAQTRELPILNANSYSFLTMLVDGLTNFPSLKEAGGSMGKAEKFAVEPTPVTSSRCLRAALGIARTLFSIGVVARFADFPKLVVPKPPAVGYFEHHRVMLRWLLHEAKRIGDSNPNIRNTFYQDDIVWLYNECGVVSLAHGQCFDAVGMLNSALKEAEVIDGYSGDGSVSHRIQLNLGVCELMRGRLKSARRLLQRVRADPDNDMLLMYISSGYIAHVDHLEGSLDEAKDGYEYAIKWLENKGRSRAVSIFRRYRADRWRYLELYEEAENELFSAIDVAKRAGYEDMVRFALVSLVRVQASFQEVTPLMIRTLDETEKYAESMDIALLRSEIAYVRAIILLEQGEYMLAGQFATMAVRTAALNGLELRAIEYRYKLAEIHQARGWTTQAERMIDHVRQSAERAGFRLLLQQMAVPGPLKRQSRARSGSDDPKKITKLSGLRPAP